MQIQSPRTGGSLYLIRHTLSVSGPVRLTVNFAALLFFFTKLTHAALALDTAFLISDFDTFISNDSPDAISVKGYLRLAPIDLNPDSGMSL